MLKFKLGCYIQFLGCGFLIHLSNRSDSPRFRAPWKKIRQKYGTRQEPSLFKGHPLSYQYGEALCSMVPSKECVGYYSLWKKLDFAYLSLGGPSHGAWVWCLGRVPKHRNQWQKVEGLLFSPQNSQLVHILSFQSQAVVSLFIFPTSPIALDSEPRGRSRGLSDLLER